MKTKLFSALLILCTPCFGSSEATRPLGFITYNIPASSSGAVYRFGVPLTGNTQYKLVTSAYSEYWQYNAPFVDVLVSTISFSGYPFVASALSDGTTPYFARIATGQQAGRIMRITANTSNSITVDVTDNTNQTTALGYSGFSLSAGDTIEIFKGNTLASLFGDGTANNPLRVQGGSTQSNADQIGIYSKTTSQTYYYYFNTNSSDWRVSNNAWPQNNFIIYPEYAIAIVRPVSSTGALRLSFLGEIPAISPLTKNTGQNYYSVSVNRFPCSIALADMKAPAWNVSTSPFSADTLGLANNTTGVVSAYFKKPDLQWYKAGGGTITYSDLLIGAGDYIGFQRRSVISGPNSFVTWPLPYNLNNL